MFYKIRHKKSKLFFVPSRYPSRNQLNAKGKVYQRLPNLKQIGPSIWVNGKQENFVESEWEIVTYKIVEVCDT